MSDECATCKGELQILYVHPRGPGDPPGNQMIPCPTCRPGMIDEDQTGEPKLLYERAFSMLCRLEWKGQKTSVISHNVEVRDCCPCCWAPRTTDRPEDSKHAPDCDLDALLRELP